MDWNEEMEKVNKFYDDLMWEQIEEMETGIRPKKRRRIRKGKSPNGGERIEFYDRRAETEHSAEVPFSLSIFVNTTITQNTDNINMTNNALIDIEELHNNLNEQQ
jgi:hypothetical protein